MLNINKINTFFSTWSIYLYLIFIIFVNKYTMPLYITHFIIPLIITIGIYGTFILYYNKKHITSKYNISNLQLFIINFISHIIPLVHVLHNKQKYINNSNQDKSIIKSILILCVIAIIYLYNYNIKTVYFNMNYYMIIIPPIIMWSLIFYNIQRLQ